MSVLNQRSHSSSIRSPLKRLALVAAFLLSLGGAGICEAENSLVVKAASLSTGEVLYTPEVSPVQESSACPDERTDVKAPQFLIIPTVDAKTGVTTYTYYAFVFWNINAEAYATDSVSFYTICGEHNDATAWYRVICDPNPLPCNKCGGGGLTASVFAFSLTDNAPIAGETPIESVKGGTFSGTTVTFPSLTTTVTVDLLPAIPKYGSFKYYQLDGGKLDTSSELTLTVGEFAIVFYNPKPPLGCPPICVGKPPI
jgi:hypothetical protein